mmetsp:Transcript_30907/g.56227  ORF Transcript_30907/g.56227 Transcript_30907/m.56227 type:complete len:137 (-) Transcript_30907:224-634(-)
MKEKESWSRRKKNDRTDGRSKNWIGGEGGRGGSEDEASDEVTWWISPLSYGDDEDQDDEDQDDDVWGNRSYTPQSPQCGGRTKRLMSTTDDESDRNAVLEGGTKGGHGMQEMYGTSILQLTHPCDGPGPSPPWIES